MRVCTVTGSRADWGLLRPVLARLRDTPTELSIIATGSHLEQRFGHTVDQIEHDGFVVDQRVPLRLSGDDSIAIATALGNAVAGIARALQTIRPDLLLLLGDRYEIFGAAQAALLLRIPIAHIAGGDISEGAYDDAMRHAISKLSHLHFATNADAQRRLLQMGEQPNRVFNAGSPGIDAIRQSPRWDRAQLEENLGFSLRRQNLAITFHPATLDPIPVDQQAAALLDALATLPENIGLIFTGGNADTGGQTVNRAIQDFVKAHANACFAVSLGQRGYYSLVEQADLVVGNSSSGLYEAPSLGTPTLDIGRRQQGRLRGTSVRHTANDPAAIAMAITDLLAHPPTDFGNPYGDGTASRRIVDVILAIGNPRELLIKHFTEIAPP